MKDQYLRRLENCFRLVPGSIKGDVKRKHFSPRGSRGRSLASSPFRRAGVVATRSSSVGFISALRHSSLAEATQAWLWSAQRANHGSI